MDLHFRIVGCFFQIANRYESFAKSFAGRFVQNNHWRFCASTVSKRNRNVRQQLAIVEKIRTIQLWELAFRIWPLNFSIRTWSFAVISKLWNFNAALWTLKILDFLNNHLIYKILLVFFAFPLIFSILFQFEIKVLWNYSSSYFAVLIHIRSSLWICFLFGFDNPK